MCATEIIMVQIEQQVLLLWRISNDKKYVHVTIPFLLCGNKTLHSGFVQWFRSILNAFHFRFVNHQGHSYSVTPAEASRSRPRTKL